MNVSARMTYGDSSVEVKIARFGDKYLMVYGTAAVSPVDCLATVIRGFGDCDMARLMKTGCLVVWERTDWFSEPFDALSLEDPENDDWVACLLEIVDDRGDRLTGDEWDPSEVSVVEEEELMALMGTREEYMCEDPVPAWDN